ncbi:uncharacterized protein CELE_C01G8.1 [Caenorhabditis elegans]|uniref:Uncharacterized protein n=1 Tax=Caenorhabditis elegans TaxID=6239 RepID=P91011_CAEEL|nr:Uncharacterized protein CELE_C01G8.1 [Caenorhabditis elegans]CCD62458.1 Uncharacterized protein CELE_C01G8.1 [Caenorhabditis elegans]|eukprot:NP_491555.1 Uncharacterized protein CELE_C01G8.1 [Caenorhabditis elegans]
MLRRIKRFLGLSTHAYFPNNEVAPTADGSLISTMSRKSTKSERKAAKKEKKRSQLADTSAPAIFHVPTAPADIVTEGEGSTVGQGSEIDRRTVITDSLPYREPSDKVYMGSPPSTVPQAPESSSSTRSLVGSDSIKSRLESMTIDGTSSVLQHVDSLTNSVYSAEFCQEVDSQNTCDAKSRELPVDCDIPTATEPLPISTKSNPVSNSSLTYMADVKLILPDKRDEKSEEVAGMKQLNAELDGLLKTSAPPFQVSTARLPPMLRELPPPANDESMLSGNDEFDDSKNNSVARYLNESHEVMMRSPENKHLRSCGY